MRNLTKRLLITSLLLLPCTVTLAEDRGYTEGSVLEVRYMRTKPGKFDEYMKWVTTEDAKWQREPKLIKAGIILSYHLYKAMPKHPEDPDIILVVEYKNLAALDDLNAKTDPIDEQIFGPPGSAAESSDVNVEDLRVLLGGELIRELKLKKK